MNARATASARWMRRTGIVCMVIGLDLTLVSVGAWALDRALPPGVLPLLARTLIAVAGELALHAWPLLMVALGAALVLNAAARSRPAAAGERR